MIGSNRLSSSPHCLNWPIFPPKIAFYENSTASSIEKIVGIHHPLHLPSILLLPTFSLSYRKGWLNRCPQMFLGGWQTHLTSWCFRRVCELLLLEGSFAYKQQQLNAVTLSFVSLVESVGLHACVCFCLSAGRYPVFTFVTILPLPSSSAPRVFSLFLLRRFQLIGILPNW